MIKAALKRFASAFGNESNNPLQKCSECGSNLISQGCPNPDCPVQIRSRLAHWCSPTAMDIAGASESVIAHLVKVGLVRDVAELYLLKTWEVAALAGFTETSAKHFTDVITASKKHEAWRLLYGLMIPRVDADVARSLCKKFRLLDDLLASGTGRLMRAEGVDEAIATCITQWWGDPVNRKLIKRLHKAGLNLNCEPQRVG